MATNDPRELRARIDKLNREADRLLGGDLDKRRRRLLGWPPRVAVALLVIWLFVPPFLLPVRGPVTSGFFLRNRPDALAPLDWEFHRGLDIAATLGSTVRASKGGIVTAAASSDSLGNYVVVRHVLGFSTTYAHLSRTSVREGSLVFKSRRLGQVGQTGRATGPHLHFELRWYGRPMPPRVFLSVDLLRRAVFELRP